MMHIIQSGGWKSKRNIFSLQDSCIYTYIYIYVHKYISYSYKCIVQQQRELLKSMTKKGHTSK